MPGCRRRTEVRLLRAIKVYECPQGPDLDTWCPLSPHHKELFQNIQMFVLVSRKDGVCMKVKSMENDCS